MRGPIDYIIVNFKQPKFEGKILEELQGAVEAGTIAVLALSLIEKRADGLVQEIVIDGQGVLFGSVTPLDNSLIGEDDVEEVGSLLEPESAAGLLVIEQLWAKGLKQAIAETGGSLIAEGRIHPDAALELETITTEES